MLQLPLYISLLFFITTLAAVVIFYYATAKNKMVLLILSAMMLIQCGLSLEGFFIVTENLPPRIALLILPPLLLLFILLFTRKGSAFLDGVDIKTLTILHALRIPVEMVLFWLFLYKAMPQIMTFEGRNMDIISGITAPLVFYCAFIKKKMGPKSLLAWNVLCLLILLVTVTTGILSAPTPFQQFAFDQPNIAVLYFPFVWLPGIVVPLVYYAHIISIRRLLQIINAKQPSPIALHA